MANPEISYSLQLSRWRMMNLIQDQFLLSVQLLSVCSTNRIKEQTLFLQSGVLMISSGILFVYVYRMSTNQTSAASTFFTLHIRPGIYCERENTISKDIFPSDFKELRRWHALKYYIGARTSLRAFASIFSWLLSGT